MRIQHNITALNAYRNLTNNNSAVAKNLEKLSSGYRINRAGDDAAGLAISEKMRAQITGLKTAQKNANDGISLVQTAEGALTEVHSMLNRMVELANQSANGTYANQPDRENLQAEVDSLLEEIDRISKATNFNGINLLDGTLGLNTDTFKIGDAIKGNTVDPTSVTTTALHTSASTGTPQGATFTIDFADLKIALADVTGANTTQTTGVSLKIGGENVTFADGDTAASLAAATNHVAFDVATTGAATSATGGTKTGGDIADELDGKFAIIGKDVYELEKDGTTGIKFTYAGRYENGKYTQDDAGNTVKSDTFDAVGEVEVNVADVTGGTMGTTTNNAIVSNRDNCHLTKIEDKVDSANAGRAGLSFKLTADMVKDGGKITIGDKTFTIDANATASTSATDTTIGIKGLTDTDDILKSVTQQLSHKGTVGIEKDGKKYQFTIGRGTGMDTIELEEVVQSDPKNYGNFSKAELEAPGIVTYGSTVKTGASTSVELTQNAKPGDSILINGVTYTFGEGKNEIAVGKDAAESAKNLAEAINKTDGKNVKAEVSGSKVTVYNADVDAADVSKAPKIGSAGLTLQIGDTSDDFNRMTVEVDSMSSTSLGIKDIDISTQGGAQVAVDKIKEAINTVSSQRGKLGAIQNRLEHTINNLSVTAENMTAAESRIRDVDMAEEMMAYTKNNILVQAAQAMLAQANQVPQGVLQLLQ